MAFAIRLVIGKSSSINGSSGIVIAPYTVMKTPPWKLIVPTVCFDLCKYKRVKLIQPYIVNIIRNCSNILRILHIFY